jgi:hypothetical protein
VERIHNAPNDEHELEAAVANDGGSTFPDAPATQDQCMGDFTIGYSQTSAALMHQSPPHLCLTEQSAAFVSQHNEAQTTKVIPVVLYFLLTCLPCYSFTYYRARHRYFRSWQTALQ